VKKPGDLFAGIDLARIPAMRSEAAILATAFFWAASAASGQTLDDVLARMRKAAGGEERLRSVSSERLTGTFSIRGGKPSSLVIELSRPGRIRVEADLSRGTFVGGFDGARAWQINPQLVPGRATGLPPALAAKIADLADIDGPLWRARVRGEETRLAREAIEGGVPTLRIAQGTKESPSVLTVNRETWRVLAWRGRLDPRRPEIEVRFEDYEETDGVFLPRCVRIGSPGGPDRIVVELSRVEIDPEIDDVWFTPPASP